MGKTPRKPTKRANRRENILLRVTKKEKELIREVASAYDMTLSQYLRSMALLNVDQRLDLMTEKDDSDE